MHLDFGKYKHVLKEFFDSKGIETNGKQYRCINPNHSDSNPSMQIYEDKFKCFSCGVHGDIYDAVGLLEGINGEAERFKYVAEFFGDKYTPPLVKNKKKIFIPDQKSVDEFINFINGFDCKNEKIIKYFESRDSAKELIDFSLDKFGYWPGFDVASAKISVETLEKAGIPINRKIDKNGKEKITTGWWPEGIVLKLGKGFKLFTMDRTLRYNKMACNGALTFPCPKLKENLEEIFLVEGEIDAFAMQSIGFDAHGLGGICGLTEEAAKIVSKIPKIYLVLDGDLRGRDGVKISIDRLKSLMYEGELYDVILPKDQDPDSLIKTGNKIALKTAIEDAKKIQVLPIELIKSCGDESEVHSTDPWALYVYFIRDCFENALVQFGEVYWFYLNDKFYWKQILKKDIHIKLKEWMAKTGNIVHITRRGKSPTSVISNVKKYLDDHSDFQEVDNPFANSATAPFVNFNNGIIEIKNKGFNWVPRDSKPPEYFKRLYQTTCLDFDFDFANWERISAERDCPSFYKFIKGIVPIEYMEDVDPQKAYLECLKYISKIIGYTISPIKKREYFFALWGREETGKSFFTKIIKNLIGRRFCVERRIEEIESDKFGPAQLWGKKVYIEPDMETRRPLPTAFIKAYSGGQDVTIEDKFQRPQHGIQISVSMFFVSNYEFRVNGTEGIHRRITMLPFKNEIPKDKIDRFLLDKMFGIEPHDDGRIFDERPAIMALAIKGLMEHFSSGHLIEMPIWAETEKEKWKKENESVLMYLSEVYFDENLKNLVKRVDLYKGYKEWCTGDGRRPLGKKNFYEDIRKVEKVREIRHSDGLYYFNINDYKGIANSVEKIECDNPEDVPF